MRISIIVPIYNAEETLNRCVSSLLDQSYENYEVILINDGSTDNSLKICLNFIDHEKVKLINQDNSGVSKARNAGIKNSSGEYICFVDSDDWVEKDYLKTFVENYVDEKTLLIQDFYKDFAQESELNANYKAALISLNERFRLLSDYELLFHGYPFAKFYSRKIIEESGLLFYEDLQFSEDLIFFLEYLKYIEFIKFIDIAQYHYILSLYGTLSKSYFSFESELKSYTLLMKIYDGGFLKEGNLDHRTKKIVFMAKGYPLTRVIESMYRKRTKKKRAFRLNILNQLQNKNNSKSYNAYNRGLVKRVAAALFKRKKVLLMDSYLQVIFWLRYIFDGIWMRYRSLLIKLKIT